MRLIVFIISSLLTQLTQAQFATSAEQQKFCKNFEQVLESGRKENFESITGTNAKQSPFLVVPGYSIHLPKFPVIYVDKDQRFVAKTNLSLDSLGAMQIITEYQKFITHCLDTLAWKLDTIEIGNDVTTPFFQEHQIIKYKSREFTLSIAVVNATEKVYSLLFYLRRRY